MGRPAKGSFEVRALADGTSAFHFRVTVEGKREPFVLHERTGCECCGGGWTERAARTEMGNLLAKARVGLPIRPEQRPDSNMAVADIPLYRDYAERFIDGKVAGTIGDAPIAANTKRDLRWRLGFSKRCLGHVPVDEIDGPLCLEFRSRLFEEAKEIKEAVAAGADLRDERGRRIEPLGLSSIRKAIEALAAVLDEAAHDGFREDNPARSKRMHVKVPKRNGTFLEADELAALLDAARDQDVALPSLSEVSAEQGTSAEAVARLAASGLHPKQIGLTLKLSKATVTYHLRRLDIDVGRGYIGRRAVCALLGYAGLRASEICDLRIGHVRVHDRDGSRLRVIDAKTPGGVRIVEVSPELAEILIEHIDRLRRAGMPAEPDDFLVPNARGGRISRQRIGKIVKAAADQASERLEGKGLPPLPNTSPHTLRRTYVSIALVANEYDVKWVMDQVGHADSTMTMEVYAKLQQRRQRHHGVRFDAVVRGARKYLTTV